MCRSVMNMEVDGRRMRGRPRFRLKDCVSNGMQEISLRERDAQYRRWKRLTGNSEPIIMMGKSCRQRKKMDFYCFFFIITVVFYKYG